LRGKKLLKKPKWDKMGGGRENVYFSAQEENPTMARGEKGFALLSKRYLPVGGLLRIKGRKGSSFPRGEE